MYRIANNVLDQQTFNYFVTKYAKINNNDKSSYDVWSEQVTNNKTLPEWYTQDVVGADRIRLIDSIRQNTQILKTVKDIKKASVAVQKGLPGCTIPPHVDKCKVSMTIFLTDEIEGGEFVVHEDNFKKELYSVIPEKNTGIIYINEGEISSQPHSVTTIMKGNRYTIQLFVG